ncbi:MAG: hypothetical protein L0212_01015, partial [Acidobacteria bacterium]|nr:hypothetical protein [Acidobacteriota bacterium]
GIGSESEANAIFVASLDGKQNKLLLHASSNVAYASGHLLFAREGTLMVQPFDPNNLDLTGDAFPLAEQVQYDSLFSVAAFSASNNGALAYHAGPARLRSRLLWFDRAGKEIGSLGETDVNMTPRLSPDGRRAVVEIYEIRSGNIDLWLHDVTRGIKTRFTFDALNDLFPVWSPDGSRIVFGSDRKGNWDIYQKASSGAGPEEVLLETPAGERPSSFSPDGRFIAYSYRQSKGMAIEGPDDIWIFPTFGDRKPFPFLQSDFDEDWPQFSPDGRWIAYESDESGTDEVYVAPFSGSGGRPTPAGKLQVSTAGGRLARWRRDGQELFYLAPDGKLMGAEIRLKSPTLEVGAVRALLQVRPMGQGLFYDVSADGQRFLVSTQEQQSPSPITLVVNWRADLKK